jgi:16S rRNA (uracil1498-N3)-methyltransferase
VVRERVDAFELSEIAATRPPRVYVPDLEEHRDPSGESREVLLSKEERGHVRSRRLRDGDEVVALDGKGTRARARLVKGGAALSLISFEASSSSTSLFPGEPSNRVTVGLACAEPARVEWAVEKGTECGAAGFVLLACERSQKAHVTALSSPARLARLRRIAVEAAKQCDRTLVPFVEGPKSTREFLGKVREEKCARLIVADPGPADHREAGGRLGPGPLPADSESTVVAIGPEGGFAPAELTLFEENGALRTSLGPRILRLETAVVAVLARLVDGR